jgi:hypothetical protein
MRPTTFPAANIRLTAPNGWTEDDCQDIHALKQGDPKFGESYIVAFKPTQADIFAQQNGEPIYIRVTGGLFPPMQCFTLDPLTQELNFEEDPT